MSMIALNKSMKHSLRQSKWGLKLEEEGDFKDEMEDQESGGDDLQEIFNWIDS